MIYDDVRSRQEGALPALKMIDRSCAQAITPRSQESFLCMNTFRSTPHEDPHGQPHLCHTSKSYQQGKKMIVP